MVLMSILVRCALFGVTSILLCIIVDYSDESYGSSEEDDQTSPIDRVLVSKKGFKDFRVKSLKLASLGRKFIGIAEHGMIVKAEAFDIVVQNIIILT